MALYPGIEKSTVGSWFFKNLVSDMPIKLNLWVIRDNRVLSSSKCLAKEAMLRWKVEKLQLVLRDSVLKSWSSRYLQEVDFNWNSGSSSLMTSESSMNSFISVISDLNLSFTLGPEVSLDLFLLRGWDESWKGREMYEI